MAGFDLASALAGVADLHKSLQGDTAKADATVEENLALGKEQAAAVDKLVGLSQDKAEFDITRKLEMEKRRQAIATNFNVDILAPDNQLAYLATEQNAAVRESVENSKRAATLRSGNIISSPLDYFIVRPFATENDAAAADAAKRATMIDKSIDDLNTQVESTFKTQTAINNTYDAAEAAKELELVAANARVEADKAKKSINNDLLNNMQTLRGFKVAEVTALTNGYTLRAEAEERAARLALHREQLNARKEEKEDKKRTLADAMAMYNRAAKEIGKAEYSNTEEFARLFGTKAGQQMLTPLIERGSSLTVDDMTAAQTGKKPLGLIAETPGSSIMYLVNAKGRSPTGEKTTKFLQDVYTEAKQDAYREANGKQVTSEQIAVDIDKKLVNKKVIDPNTGKETKGYVPGKVSTMLKDPEREDSIYKLPDISTIATAKGLSGVPDYDITQQKWWKPMVEAAGTATGKGNQAVLDANTLFHQAKAAIASGQLTVEEAAQGYVAFYRHGIRTNEATENYSKVGLPNVVAYPVKIDDSGLTGRVPILGDKIVINYDPLAENAESRIRFELAKSLLRSRTRGMELIPGMAGVRELGIKIKEQLPASFGGIQ